MESDCEADESDMKKKYAKKFIKELSMISYWMMKIEQQLDPDYGKTVEFRRFVPLPEIAKPLKEMEEK